LEKITGEFKSIRVSDDFRNKGIRNKIIPHLIIPAKKLGIKKPSIETGSGNFFPPARKLFEPFKFTKCKPFPPYQEDPNSCYYPLDL
jgi:N-acetylglutamate synthase and related acetyltransferases